MKELLKALLSATPGTYAGDSVLGGNDGNPTANTVEPKTAPNLGEIDQWNKFLGYFNDKAKKDGVTDQALDAGDGSYAKNTWDEWAAANKISSPYDETTKKMQDYYINLYNSKDQFASSLVKNNYPKEELSAVDGRVGSLTRNYYIPTMNYAKTVKDKSGDKTYSFKAIFNPFSESQIDVAKNSMVDDNNNPLPDEGVINFYKEYAAQKAGVKK